MSENLAKLGSKINTPNRLSIGTPARSITTGAP